MALLYPWYWYSVMIMLSFTMSGMESATFGYWNETITYCIQIKCSNSCDSDGSNVGWLWYRINVTVVEESGSIVIHICNVDYDRCRGDGSTWHWITHSIIQTSLKGKYNRSLIYLEISMHKKNEHAGTRIPGIYTVKNHIYSYVRKNFVILF